MRFALITNRNLIARPAENVAGHIRWMERAAREGARLVLFPELSLSGYSHGPFIDSCAMTFRDDPPRQVMEAARELGITVSFGMPWKSRGKIYLSQILAGPTGMVGHYEKVHLAEDPNVFTPGEEFRVWDVEGVKVGLNICFDGRHPGASLATAHLGAEVILQPHANVCGEFLGWNPDDWTTKKHHYLRQRAVDTATYFLICNQTGNVPTPEGRTVRFSGGAMALDPDGEAVARTDFRMRRPHMLMVDLDIEGLREHRRRAFFRQRRPDTYASALAKKAPLGNN